MPIYAFACDACGHHFDRLQKLSDADPTTCPACAAEGQVHRQLTAPQFRLAGSGWYETDFKKDGEKKSNLAGEAAKPAESKSESKSETSSKTPPATGSAQ
jgi:putative FmdB family regulatory protein